MTHEEFAAHYKARRISVTINRPMARKFFTRIPLALIRQETGESLYFEKGLIRLTYLLSPVILAATIAVGFLVFHIWGFLLMIGCTLIYVLYSSASMRENAGLTLITLMLFIALISHFFNSEPRFSWTKLVVLFLSSLWSVRFVYTASAYFLRLFVLRNEKAFAYLSKYLNIHEQVL